MYMFIMLVDKIQSLIFEKFNILSFDSRGFMVNCSHSDCNSSCNFSLLLQKCNLSSYNQTQLSKNQKQNDPTYDYFYKFNIVLYIAEVLFLPIFGVFGLISCIISLIILNNKNLEEFTFKYLKISFALSLVFIFLLNIFILANYKGRCCPLK